MTTHDIFILDIEGSVIDANKVGYDSTTATLRRIYLQVTKITYSGGVNVQTDDQPGKSISEDSADLIAYGDFVGISNAKITVQGIIDLDTYSKTTGLPSTTTYSDSTGSNTADNISVKLLQQIRKTGHTFQLTDYYEYNESTGVPIVPIYRIHGLTGVFPNETLAPLKVMCTGLTITSNTQVKDGVKLDYTLTFNEVRT